MVNVRNIKADKLISIGFETKKEALEFIKSNNLKSNKNETENDFINIVKMKRKERIQNKINNIVVDITNKISGNEDYTLNEIMNAKMAKEIIEKVNVSDKKLMFTVQYDNDEIRSYVNDRNNFLTETSELTYGSDTQDQVINHNVKSINIKQIEKTGNNKSIGAFFKYYNLTDIDLSRYGIYKNIEESDYSDNCLIHSLKQSNIFTEEEISNIIIYCKTNDTSLNTINKISEEFNINFNIYRYRNDSVKIEKNTNIKSKKESNTKTIDLALYSDHWFLYENINISKFYIENYYKIKNLNIKVDTLVNRYCKVTNKYVIRKDTGNPLNTLSLVNLMYKQNLFTKIPIEQIMSIPGLYKDDKIILPKIIQESNYRLKCKDDNLTFVEEKEKNYEFITFADYETTTMKNDKVNADKHKPFMLSYITININNEIIDSETIHGYNLSLTFLDKLKDKSIIYFHNLKYDKNFFLDNLYIIQYIEKEGQLYEIQACYKKKYLRFRDSYKLISEPLKNFTDMFYLKFQKEIFPYNFYNESNINKILNNQMMSIKAAKKHLKEEDHNDFDICLKNVTKTEVKFNALEYAKYYCEQDVKVLHQGMMIFREMVLKTLDIDIFDKLTISSVADQYLINEGAYNNVYEISGSVQGFIAKSIKGGRVMIAKNKPIEVIGITQDFDACGLYASAMHTMKGFPVGKPSIIDETFDINQDNLYYIEIEILDEYYNRGIGNKINIEKYSDLDLEYNRHEFDYDFPLWSDNTDGVLEYTNFPKERNHVVNNDIMQDLIKFYKLELNKHYKIVQGVTFNEGYNTKINDIMRFLYDERKKHKANKNNIEIIYKLIMNSSYGKSIMKYSNCTTKIFMSYHQDTINRFIYKNYNNIKEIKYTKNHTIISIYKEYSKHWNCAHVGSAVLARSKVIMNKIFYEFHLKGMTPFYQDTDSIHIPENQVSLLSKTFIGNDMCQFHCDFDAKDFEKKFGKPKDISIEKDLPLVYASRSIFIAKKCYIDVLNHRLYPEKQLYHIRFKGVSDEIIVKTSEELNKTPYELYKDILNGSEIEFNDKFSSKPKFKQYNLSSIGNRGDTIKTIKIKNK